MATEVLEIPVHVSGFWRPVYTRDPLSTGSLGAGLVLRPYTLVSPGDRPCIEVDGLCIDMPHLEIARELYRVERGVVVRPPVPLGVGAGVSANISIGLGLLASQSMGLGRGRERLVAAGVVGHEIEVRAMTGLGDVITELLGHGIEVRRRPGAPCIGEVESIEVPGGVVATLGVVSGGVSTTDMLRIYRDRFDPAYREALEVFERGEDIGSLVEASRIFSARVGFLTREREEALRDLLREGLGRGDVLGFFIKKSLVVVVHERDHVVSLRGRVADMYIRETRTMEPVERPVLDGVDEKTCREVLEKREEALYRHWGGPGPLSRG